MATVLIKNTKQLDKIMESYIKSALKKTQDEIALAIQESINEFYKEYSPTFYKRTYKFLNSLVKTDIRRIGNTIQCEVKIDEEYLKYSYPNKGFSHNLSATGLDVVQWANRDIHGFGNHGGSVDVGRNDGFFNAGLQDLGGNIGIVSIFKTNLQKRGLKIG